MILEGQNGAQVILIGIFFHFFKIENSKSKFEFGPGSGAFRLRDVDQIFQCMNNQARSYLVNIHDVSKGI